MRQWRMVATAAVFAALATAQDEATLKRRFEGKNVVVKMDMPATKDGVDVRYGRTSPIDFNEYSRRIRDAGVALRSGESVMVTQVKVKSNLVEFQLGGGGYGTFFDEKATREYVHHQKSDREKEIERELRGLDEHSERAKHLRRELRDLRERRERRDAREQAIADERTAIKAEVIAQKALQSGSRFNIRFPDGYLKENPPTPEMLMEILAEWVEFAR